MYRYFITLKKTHGRGEMISQYFDTFEQAEESMKIVLKLDRGVMFVSGRVQLMTLIGA